MAGATNIRSPQSGEPVARVSESLLSLRWLEDFSRRQSAIHRLHPVSKLLTTVCYLVAVTSFGSKELIGLVPFVLFPVMVGSLAELPARPVLQRMLYVSPIIIGIGILNPLFDRELVSFGGVAVAGGWIVFLSLILKGALTVSTAIVLVGTTGVGGIGAAMRVLRLPRVFIVQFLLVFRYLSLLLEEVAKVLRAYDLRAPGRRGIGKDARGSLPGTILIRTYDRGLRVYEAMKLRGFSGEFPSDHDPKLRAPDIAFLLAWTGFFVVARFVDIPGAIGSLFLRMVIR